MAKPTNKFREEIVTKFVDMMTNFGGDRTEILDVAMNIMSNTLAVFVTLKLLEDCDCSKCRGHAKDFTSETLERVYFRAREHVDGMLKANDYQSLFTNDTNEELRKFAESLIKEKKHEQS